jgi:RHS repeat-associated protein
LSGKARIWRYAWDADDNLTAVTTPDAQLWRYRYDPLGRRIAKQRMAPDGTTVLEQVDFVWDGSNLAETVHVGRTTTWDWAPGGVRPISQVDRVVRSDTPQAEIDQRFYAIISDIIGTPTQLVNPGGRIAWHQETSLWGALLARANSETHCPLRFPGQYHDPETGLDYNYHRYYDPAIGQYLSPDPLGLLASLNQHAYVDNPVAWSDPLGLVPCNAQGQVDYGKGLSKAVQDQRLIDKNMENNYAAAVYKVKDADGNVVGYSDPVVEHSAGKLHSEQRLIAKLKGMGVDPQDVSHLYSEFQPCSRRCGPLLSRELSPDAKITWSWPWDKSGTPLADASQAAKKAAVRALFGN